MISVRAMCCPGWGNFCAFDWNSLPVGREFDGKFLKNVKSPPHALPPPPAGFKLIGALDEWNFDGEKQEGAMEM